MSQPDRNLSFIEAALLATGLLVVSDGLLHGGRNTYQPVLQRIVEPPIPPITTPAVAQESKASVLLPSDSESLIVTNYDGGVKVVTGLGDASAQELQIFTQDVYGGQLNSDELVIFTYSPGGDNMTFVPLSKEAVNFSLSPDQRPPKPVAFTVPWYGNSRKEQEINPPDWLWEDVTDGCAWATKETGKTCDPRLLIAVLYSENPDGVTNAKRRDDCSGSNACGLFQFLEATFNAHSPGFGDRFEPRASAFAAAKMTATSVPLQSQTDRDAFALQFTGQTYFGEGYQGSGVNCWNCNDSDGTKNDIAVKQALWVWDVWQKLRAVSQQSPDLQPISQVNQENSNNLALNTVPQENQEIKYGETFNLVLET